MATRTSGRPFSDGCVAIAPHHLLVGKRPLDAQAQHGRALRAGMGTCRVTFATHGPVRSASPTTGPPTRLHRRRARPLVSGADTQPSVADSDTGFAARDGCATRVSRVVCSCLTYPSRAPRLTTASHAPPPDTSTRGQRPRRLPLAQPTCTLGMYTGVHSMHMCMYMYMSCTTLSTYMMREHQR